MRVRQTLYSLSALESEIVIQGIAHAYPALAIEDQHVDIVPPRSYVTGRNGLIPGRMVRLGVSRAFKNDIPAVTVRDDPKIGVQNTLQLQPNRLVVGCALQKKTHARRAGLSRHGAALAARTFLRSQPDARCPSQATLPRILCSHWRNVST